jgi:hypothetical protein
MKTKILTAVVASLLVSASSLLAQAPILFDNFDSYANQAAMNAAWPVLGGGGAILSTEQAFSPSQSAKQDLTGRVSYRDITPVWGLNSAPLTFAFEFYDSTQANNLRQFASIRDNSPALAQLVAMGAYNDTTLTKNRYTGLSVTAADLNTYYAVRVAFSPGPNWFILNGPGAPTRSTGWHELRAVFYSTTVEFFVDGVNALTGLTTSYASAAGGISFDRVGVGSGLSSANGVGYYDNVVVVIPEPSSIVLSVLGGLSLLCVLRRRTA